MDPSLARRSVWLDVPFPAVQELAADTTCDACVVGGGIAGLLVAHRLVEQGKSVVVIDAGPLVGGETSRTTAHLVTALDDRFSSLAALHGARGAHLLAQSHAAAIDYVEDLVRQLQIECGWRRMDGYLTVNERHFDRRDKLLAEELEAAANAGLEVERVEHLPRPWPSIGPALRFARQAQFHPTKFLAGVVRRLLEKGARLYAHSRAVEIAEKKGGVAVAVHNFKGPVVTCKHAVVATNTPVNTLVAIHTKQSGYQTYVIALRVPAGAFPEPVLLWDGLWEDDTSYHYVRLMQGNPGRDDLLIVGGEDHKTGQGPEGAEPYRCIEEWARRNFPMCGAVERRWSGEVMEPSDGVAYIGRAPGKEHTFLVTGDSGNGMTHSAIAAMIIPDLIVQGQHPWESLYDPSRKVGWHAWKDYAEENLNTVAQYRDWLTRGTATSEDAIKPGTGAVVTHGLRHLAVYKDESGHCTRLSAVCPHLGGVVRWNDQEQTWDCPCHASRFDRHGKVIHGPANSNLSSEQ